MARDTATHEEFARNWSPATGARDYQETKVNGHQPIEEDE